MSLSYPMLFFICSIFSLGCFVCCDSGSWYVHQYVRHAADRKFEQRTDHFWEFEEESNSWIEVKLPYDLVSCVNDNCTKVGTIKQMKQKSAEHVEKEPVSPEGKKSFRKQEKGGFGENSYAVLPVRKRVSLTRMSDRSIWVTAQSGSIYERFWNGVQWVIAPHDLPESAGHAVAVFIVNQTILALSEAGNLYQMQLTESSHLLWADFRPVLNPGTSGEEEQSYDIQLVSGVMSHDKERIYFCTKNGTLLELVGVDPIRWINHGHPPRADVAAIADAGTFRSQVIFTISSAGDLYEYDQSARPSWKKHIQKEGSAENTSLAPSGGCASVGAFGAHFTSLFLLTKDNSSFLHIESIGAVSGTMLSSAIILVFEACLPLCLNRASHEEAWEGGDLAERRLHQRKWRWILHRNPDYYPLTSITCVSQDELDESSSNIFLTTAAGDIYEYSIAKQSGTAQANQILDDWVNHMHPPHAKAASGVAGLQLQVGRMIFPLDDGRLAELHVPGLGGESSPPNQQISVRRKASLKYVWTILDAPESEGWNAEYCTEEHGPLNCITGIRDEYDEADDTRSILKRRKGTNAEQNYLSIGRSGSSSAKSSEEYSIPDNWITKTFRLRSMHGAKSFFFITDDGMLLEFISTEDVQFWLRHEHPTAVRGAVGSYNGSLFLVDERGGLLIRERGGNELGWINCTAMRKSWQLIGGPPWDGLLGRTTKASAEDAIFFVSKSGKLLQLTVALGNFKWKDCKNPPNTKLACIIDQEVFRQNIVFVIGRNGRLYQYNKITELWHEHYQSQHLTMSRSPGTTMRPSLISLRGSLFMLSETGGLVEYHWNSLEGWHWIEHGTPSSSVAMVGSPGPCLGNNELFLIGSDGKVYLRYYDQATWKWKDCGFPYTDIKTDENANKARMKPGNEEICMDEDLAASFEKMQEHIHALYKNCDPKVSSTRPTPFTEDSIIFQLRDGRLAELQRNGEKNWAWSRTIATPTTLCMASFRTTSTPENSNIFFLEVS